MTERPVAPRLRLPALPALVCAWLVVIVVTLVLLLPLADTLCAEPVQNQPVKDLFAVALERARQHFEDDAQPTSVFISVYPVTQPFQATFMFVSPSTHEAWEITLDSTYPKGSLSNPTGLRGPSGVSPGTRYPPSFSKSSSYRIPPNFKDLTEAIKTVTTTAPALSHSAEVSNIRLNVAEVARGCVRVVWTFFLGSNRFAVDAQTLEPLNPINMVAVGAAIRPGLTPCVPTEPVVHACEQRPTIRTSVLDEDRLTLTSPRVTRRAELNGRPPDNVSLQYGGTIPMTITDHNGKGRPAVLTIDDGGILPDDPDVYPQDWLKWHKDFAQLILRHVYIPLHDDFQHHDRNDNRRYYRYRGSLRIYQANHEIPWGNQRALVRLEIAENATTPLTSKAWIATATNFLMNLNNLSIESGSGAPLPAGIPPFPEGTRWSCISRYVDLDYGHDGALVMTMGAMPEQ